MCESQAAQGAVTGVTPLHGPESRLDWFAGAVQRNAGNSTFSLARVKGDAGLAPDRVIIGPPGCGKTHALLGALEAELRAGTRPERVAFVAFTRAARQEAQARVCATLGVSEEKLPWLRTVHSAAFTLLDMRHADVVDQEHWDAFGARCGYDFTPLDPADPWAGRTVGDVVRSAYDWGRNTLTPVDRIPARWVGERVCPRQLELFVRRYEAFKCDEGLADFCDMLGTVLERGRRPDVDAAFIDEAQDLSPLQVAVVSMWFRGVRTVVAGDDDQAVYVFQGADTSWLRQLAQTYPTEVLSQSYRVPVRVHALAQRTIKTNRDRVPKEYRPDPRPGVVREVDLAQALDATQDRSGVLVLVRNRQFIPKVAGELMRRHVPFAVEGPGRPNPLGNQRLVRALHAAHALSEGKGVAAKDLENLLGFVGGELVPKGLRQRAREDGELCRLYMPASLRGELGIGALLDLLFSKGPLATFTRLGGDTRRYLEVLLAGSNELPGPRFRVTTIHGAKGRQADTVLLLSAMSRKSYREYCGSVPGRERESRVFYVGVTRARQELYLVRSNSRRTFPFPSGSGVGV